MAFQPKSALGKDGMRGTALIQSWHEFCHVYVSHRPESTSGRGGVTTRLYNALSKISMNNQDTGVLFLIPEGLGRWPRNVRIPAGWTPWQARIFKDSIASTSEDCEEVAEDCEESESLPLPPAWIAAAKACASSQLFCPILSWGDDNDGSVGQLMSIKPSDGQDRVDPFLLELSLARYLLKENKDQIRVICPILYGSQQSVTSGCTFTPFPLKNICMLSSEASARTNQRLLDLLEALGHTPRDTSIIMEASVQTIISDVASARCGVQLSEDLMIEQAAGHVMRTLVESKKEVPQLRFFSKPCAEEVMQWLDESRLGHYTRIFERENICSLAKAKTLTHAQIERLHQDSGVGEMKALVKAVELLAKDDRSLSMQQRVKLFQDKSVSATSALVSSKAVHTACGSWIGRAVLLQTPVWAIGAIGIHASWHYWWGDAGYLPCANSGVILEPKRYWRAHLAMDVLLGLIEIAGVTMLFSSRPRTAYLASYVVWVCPGIVGLICFILASVECYLGTGVGGADGVCVGGFGWRCNGFFFFVIMVSCAWQSFVLTKYERFFFISCCFFGLSVNSLYLAVQEYIFIAYRPLWPVVLLFIASGIPPFFGSILARKYYLNRRYAFTLIDTAAYDKEWSDIQRDTPPVTMKRLYDLLYDMGNIFDEQFQIFQKRQQQSFGVLKRMGTRVALRGRIKVDHESLHGTRKVRQPHNNLDKLFEDACTMNPTIQLWMAQSNLADQKTSFCLPGPVKKPTRCIEKLVRCYNHDAACLTDLVRCTLVCDTMDDVLQTVLGLVQLSHVGLEEATAEEAQRMTELNEILKETHLDKVNTVSLDDYDPRAKKGNMFLRRVSSAISSAPAKTHIIPSRHPLKRDRLSSIQPRFISSNSHSSSRARTPMYSRSSTPCGTPLVRMSQSPTLTPIHTSPKPAQVLPNGSFDGMWAVRVRSNTVTPISHLGDSVSHSSPEHRSNGHSLNGHSMNRVEEDMHHVTPTCLVTCSGEHSLSEPNQMPPPLDSPKHGREGAGSMSPFLTSQEPVNFDPSKEPWMRLVEIKDRYFSKSGSAGYRDLNVKVEIAWDRTDPTRLIFLRELEALRTADPTKIGSIIFEIQILLSSIYHLKEAGSHKKYVQFRNIVTNP